MVRTPTYRLHKPSGKAVCTLGGRDHYLGVYGSPESKKLYRRLLSEYLAVDGDVKKAGNESYSISQLIAAFLRFAKKHYGADNTQFGHYGRLGNRIRKIYGPTVAAEFGSLQFKAIRNEMVLEGKARSYVNETMKRLVRIFRWGAGEELVPPTIGALLREIEPLKRGRTTAREMDPILPVDDSLVERTIPNLPPVVADMVRLQRLVGCRPSEVCSITPSMVDRTLDIWEIRLSQHKNAWRGKSRTIFVGPKAQAVLAPYLLRAAETFCFSPAESEKKRRQKAHDERTTPLSCGNKPGTRKKQRSQGLIPPKCGIHPGRRYTRTSYARAITRACLASMPEELSESEVLKWKKLNCWSPNQLRHTFGTQIRREFGLEESQVLLGHSSADTTQIYAEIDAEKARVAARRIG